MTEPDTQKKPMTNDKASFALYIIEEMKALLSAMRASGGDVSNYSDDMDMLMSFAFQLDDDHIVIEM